MEIDIDEQDGFYMNQNGLFLKEFEDTIVDDNGKKFKSIQCAGNLELTKYYISYITYSDYL